MDNPIPPEWTLTTIDNIADYIGSGISRPFYSDQVGLPVLRSNNVKDGNIVLDELKYWHEIDPRGADLEGVRPQFGDILINFVNGSAKELGKSAVFRGEPSGCIVSTNFFIVRIRRELAIPDYISEYLQTDYYRDWLTSVVGFTGQGSFNQKELRRLQIPLPPLLEQERIAVVSNTWDCAIRQLTDLIAAKVRFKQGLMQQLLTGKRCFKGFDDKWKSVRLGDIATKIGSGVTPKGGSSVYTTTGIPFIRSQNVIDDKLSLAGVAYISPSVHQTMKGSTVKNDDVLLNITGASIGRSCVARNLDGEANVNQHVCIIRPDSEVNPTYLQSFLSSGLGQNQINALAAGGNREGLNYQNVASIRLSLPSLKVQVRVAKILRTADHEIDLLQQELDALKKQKKGLMQKLLTGEVRVKL